MLLSPVKHISDLAAAAQYLVRAHIAFADQVADEATEEDNRLCYSSYAALVQLSMALQQLENTRNTMQTMFLEESIDKFKVCVTHSLSLVWLRHSLIDRSFCRFECCRVIDERWFARASSRSTASSAACSCSTTWP